MSETMELAVVNSQNAVQIFTRGGMKAVLDDIESKVRALGPMDVSTPTGRDAIRSTAYLIAKTKTALDAEGKRLTEGWREATKRVNQERSVATERLEALALEVRKPLTDFETKEKLRVAAHEDALSDITGLHAMIAAHPNMETALLEEHLDDLAKVHSGRDWEEFAAREAALREAAAKYIGDRLVARRTIDTQQAELARLRKEEIDRLARERDERLKADAADKARLEAERKAKVAADLEARRVIEAAERERSRVEAEAARVKAENERARKQAEDKARAERERLESQAREIERKRQAEADARLAAERRAKAIEEKAAADLKSAKEKAKRESDAAVGRELERIERERKAAEHVRLQREADEQHRSEIRAEMIEDLAKCGDLMGRDEMIADAIMAGLIRHVKVVY